MFYLDLYCLAAAVYCFCLQWWHTAHANDVEKVLAEYELNFGEIVNHEKFICFSIIAGSVVWPIGTIVILSTKVYYTMKKHK